MSREAIRARLEWLQLMGVDHVPAGRRTPAPPAAAGTLPPVTTAREASPDEPGVASTGASQPALFGDSVQPAAPP